MYLEKNPKTRPIVKKILELEDKVFGLAFPNMARIRQVDVNSCGPAVLASLYSIFGIKVSQKHVVISLRAQNKIKKFGLSMADMAKASSIFGKKDFVFWKKANAKVSDLDLIINKYKCPVGVEWQGVFYEDEDEDNGHYAIITKIDKKTGFLRLSDPYALFAGVDRKFKIKEFVNRWWDENTIKGRNIVDNHIMFVITEKDVSWPKKLGMKKSV